LLNTDLHVAQGNHPRMTRSQFIDNTMSTIQDQYKKGQSVNKAWETEVEAYLKVSTIVFFIHHPKKGKS
jgi:Sec7-like guanine-nucleotide exchange factor